VLSVPFLSGEFSMPYKNLQSKREWELQHRVQRLARRRELRQIDAAWKQAQPEALGVNDPEPSLLLPVVAGGALAAHNPKLAMGVGGLMLLSAVIYKIRRVGAGGLAGH
jgi:hypothetical protein